MGLRQRIISEVYDEKDGKVVNREIIKDKEIKKPDVIEDLGYDHKEQIDILKLIQDAFFSGQSAGFISEECKFCGSQTRRVGFTECVFHSVYTDHKVQVPRRLCLNKACGKRSGDTIHSIFGNNMHPDLVKKQTKIGANCSFMDAQKYLEADNGSYRKVNNQLTIKKNIDRVGQILSKIHLCEPEIATESAKTLIVQVDGGYIKSKNGSSFEALVSNIYKPEDHELGYINANGFRVSGIIKKKIYSASSLGDRGKTIRGMTIVAAKKLGLNKETHVTALSDGARNCWDVLKTLEKECSKIEYILDWCHIKRKFESLDNKIEEIDRKKELKSVKWKIWHGKSKEAIERLNVLNLELLSADYTDQVNDLLKYLVNNSKYLVNYKERMKANLPYTSSVIESTIETLVNDRHKKKHKAQWTRETAHNILQIRSSIASNQWEDEWTKARNVFYKNAA
jgi:hypothetical protein